MILLATTAIAETLGTLFALVAAGIFLCLSAFFNQFRS